MCTRSCTAHTGTRVGGHVYTRLTVGGGPRAPRLGHISAGRSVRLCTAGSGLSGSRGAGSHLTPGALSTPVGEDGALAPPGDARGTSTLYFVFFWTVRGLKRLKTFEVTSPGPPCQSWFQRTREQHVRAPSSGPVGPRPVRGGPLPRGCARAWPLLNRRQPQGDPCLHHLRKALTPPGPGGVWPLGSSLPGSLVRAQVREGTPGCQGHLPGGSRGLGRSRRPTADSVSAGLRPEAPAPRTLGRCRRDKG
ncbi:hypothetical protein VULLAG_LOCUS1288 [Vulpes lagopus]